MSERLKQFHFEKYTENGKDILEVYIIFNNNNNENSVEKRFEELRDFFLGNKKIGLERRIRTDDSNYILVDNGSIRTQRSIEFFWELENLKFLNKEKNTSIEIITRKRNLLEIRVENEKDDINIFNGLFNEFYNIMYNNFFEKESLMIRLKY